MNKTISAAAIIAIAALLAACGGGGRMGSTALPPQQGTMDEGAIAFQAVVPDAMAPHTAGINLPAVLGTFKSHYGVIGGFTQKVRSQVLAFPPGTKLVIKNLSKTVPHTFNVLSNKRFPTGSLQFAASGGNKLKVGYRSGILQPGQSKTVILAFPGTYFIGCAYHYNETPHMRDVIVVKKGVAPGPQATAPPSSNPSSSPSSTPYTPPPGGGGYDPH